MYLDPQDIGPSLSDPDYPIRKEEEEEQYSLYTPAHPTFQSQILPLTTAISEMITESSSGSGVSAAMQNAINAAIANIPQ